MGQAFCKKRSETPESEWQSEEQVGSSIQQERSCESANQVKEKKEQEQVGSSIQQERSCESANLVKEKKKQEQMSMDQAAVHDSRLNVFSGKIVCARVPSGIRRTIVPERPKASVSVWGILKNNLGKDLSTIPFPVNFSEPLSLLQRLTEDYEYSYLLDIAAQCKNSLEQLAYLAAFTISCYSSVADRTCKPFNPLLGETFECDRREDLGWRAISEQVSHHPPISAQHCESDNWTCWQDFSIISKFKGTTLHAVPEGMFFCKFKSSGNQYIWKKVTTIVHNIIMGRLWLDQKGETEIVDVHNKCKCILTYSPYSSSADNQRKVTGVVLDASGSTKWFVKGVWNSYVDIAPALNKGSSSENLTLKPDKFKRVWKVNCLPPNNEHFYNFTYFACQLNELESGVAPTDSRLRPDQRFMENGLWTEANEMKQKLEDKQRTVRKLRENQTDVENRIYEPVWFKQVLDPSTNQNTYIYKGGYWEHKAKQDWSLCPDLFSV